jgi:basic amino acid/polyamine antiporter, APA family
LKPRTVFTREATGLVRDISVHDIFQYNTSSFAGPWTALAIIGMSPLVGGWPLLWLLIGTATIFPTILIYNMLAAAMPRTGGDYIYVSRILHPSLGLAIVGIEGFLMPAFFLGGVYGTGWIMSGASPALLVAGTVLGIPSLTSLAQAMTVPMNIAIIGFLSVLIFGLVCALTPIRVVMKTVVFFMIIGSVLGVLSEVVILFVPNSQFIQLFDSVARNSGTSYSDVINTAKSLGWMMPEFNFYNSLLGSTLPWGCFVWILYSTTLAGEVKNARRSLLRGNMLTLGVWFLVITVMVLGILNTVGQDFQSAALFLQIFHPSSWKFPVATSITLYAALATRSAFLSALFAIGWGSMLFAGIPWCYLQISRMSFALSFDRVFPAWLSDVNERFHTPLKAIILAGVMGTFVLILFILPTTQSTLLFFTTGIVPGCAIAWMLTSIAGVLFPYRAKGIFELSPYKGKIAGIYKISIVGAISAVLCALYIGIYIAYPTYFGLGTSTMQALQFLSIQVGTIVVFFLLYFAIRAYRKSQGLDIELAFKEVPPE